MPIPTTNPTTTATVSPTATPTATPTVITPPTVVGTQTATPTAVLAPTPAIANATPNSGITPTFNPAPTTTGTPPPCPTPTLTETPDLRPIVLDLGPGWNVGEIIEIINKRVPFGFKVIAIDKLNGLGLLADPRLQPFINSGQLEIIHSRYDNPSVLNGRKAVEAVSFFPQPSETAKPLEDAVRFHLIPNGSFYVATEDRNIYDQIRTWNFISWIYGPSQTTNSDIEKGNNGPRLAVRSTFSLGQVWDAYGVFIS